MKEMKVGDRAALKYVVNDGKNFMTFIVAIPSGSGSTTGNDEVKPTENARLGSNRM